MSGEWGHGAESWNSTWTPSTLRPQPFMLLSTLSDEFNASLNIPLSSLIGLNGMMLIGQDADRVFIGDDTAPTFVARGQVGRSIQNHVI